MVVRSVLCIYVGLIPFLAVNAQPKSSHPYLFFTKTAIDAFKTRIKADTSTANYWQEIQTRADNSLTTPMTPAAADIETLCLAYRLTGDKKYAAKAKELLQHLIDQPAWDGMDDRTPRWNSGLNTGKNCFASALCFDCIYDYLTPAERKTFAGQITLKGIRPSFDDWLSADRRLHALNSMGHNWWSAVVNAAGVASLAVMNEQPEARQWAQEIMRASTEWFDFDGSVLDNKPRSFDRDGGFYESIGYANFALTEYLNFRLAWTNCLGPVAMPYDSMLVKTMDWFIHACYPNTGPLQSLNFGDSNPFGNAQQPVTLMLALGFHKESFDWYLQQIQHTASRNRPGANPLTQLYSPANTAPAFTPGLPPSALYKDMGWATLRSSWDTNATLLGVKCGFTWNHAHADAGSFVLYHKGKNLLIDGGDAFYGSDEYSNYFVRSEAHNVMLFNDKAQDPQDEYHAVKNPGALYHLMDGGDIKYLLADAQGPTAHYFLRNFRSFLWIGNVILVIDDVKAYEPGKFQWLLHYEGQAKQQGPDLDITDGDAGVLVRPLFPETLPMGYPHDFPEKMILEQRLGYKDHDVKTRLPYYAISPPEPATTQKFINAIILLDSTNHTLSTFTGSSGASGSPAHSNLPHIQRLQGADYIGVRITQNGNITDVYFNLLADGRLMHRNSNAVIDGWETDAYLFAVTYPETTTHETISRENATGYFVANGSYLRRNGNTILNTLSKVFLITAQDKAAQDKAETRVLLQGQPLIHAELDLNQKPASLILNNQPIKPVFAEDHKTIVIDLADKNASP